MRQFRSLGASVLVQDADRFVVEPSSWEVATKARPTEAQWRDLALAWKVCARTTSNAIAVVTDGQAVGVGAGQQSRVVAAEIAVAKAGSRARGRGRGQRRLLPLPRRPAGSGRRRGGRRGPARGLHPGRRGDRRSRRGRAWPWSWPVANGISGTEGREAVRSDAMIGRRGAEGWSGGDGDPARRRARWPPRSGPRSPTGWPAYAVPAWRSGSGPSWWATTDPAHATWP